MPTPFALAIHGGAGALPASRVPVERIDEMRRDLGLALDAGLAVLGAGGSSLDAVVAAIVVMEDSRVFNAARGAVLRNDGSARLDASVMSGEGRRAGAVCVLRGAKNPVRVAQAVLARGREVLLAGDEADRFAREAGLELRPADYFITDYRREQLARLASREGMALDHDVALPASGKPPDEGQTVGAVALDMHGHLAAATSTGGMTNASPGRVGDSPIIGAGTWASDDTVAVSATGTGEFFIRAAFAHEVHSRVAWRGSELGPAAREALDLVTALGGQGGCVAVDRAGRVTTPFTTSAMPRAYQAAGGPRSVYVLEPDAL
ncbi:MAG TPA: isoaspartyl peptidase/L-asparaginase [Polyangiaceae bacterium]|nr:isoaspartyl peptidase/L-asparaginase [Polyangiaceae bacterium]